MSGRSKHPSGGAMESGGLMGAGIGLILDVYNARMLFGEVAPSPEGCMC